MKNKVKLSLCMIVKDEERNLPGCLQSAQGLVDEIVVVDTGSKDRTPEIARDFGAKVYPFKWTNDFAAARNESLRHANGDYVIWLDADDRIPKEERKKFLRWKKGLSSQDPKAYWFILESPKEDAFLTEHCYQLRAFPRREGVKFIRRVHETVLESLRALGIPTVYCDVTIRHIGYANKDDMQRKASRNLKLLLTALSEAPKDPTLYWHLTMTYGVLGKKQKSARYAEALLDLLPEGTPDEEARQWYTAARIHLANLYGELGREEEAEELLRKALENDPHNPMACFFLAKLLMKRSAYHEALTVLEPLRDRPLEVLQVPYPLETVRFYIHLWLGNCYEALGEREKALGEYALASEVNPRWAERGAEIGEFYLRQGETERALKVLERALEEDPLNPSILSNLAVAYKRKGDVQKAEEFFRRALELEPEHFDALANLGHLLLLNGKLEEATPLLQRATLIRADIDLVAALVFIAILRGRIEEALPHTERIMEIMEEGANRTLDTLGDYALLLEELAKGLQSKGHLYEAHLLSIASRHLLQQEALLSSAD